jgi:transposase-like protein
MPPPRPAPIDLYCPLCRSDEAMLNRTLRSSDVFRCRDCDHEWEVEHPAVAAPEMPAQGPVDGLR